MNNDNLDKNVDSTTYLLNGADLRDRKNTMTELVNLVTLHDDNLKENKYAFSNERKEELKVRKNELLLTKNYLKKRNDQIDNLLANNEMKLTYELRNIENNIDAALDKSSKFRIHNNVLHKIKIYIKSFDRQLSRIVGLEFIKNDNTKISGFNFGNSTSDIEYILHENEQLVKIELLEIKTNRYKNHHVFIFYTNFNRKLFGKSPDVTDEQIENNRVKKHYELIKKDKPWGWHKVMALTRYNENARNQGIECKLAEPRNFEENEQIKKLLKEEKRKNQHDKKMGFAYLGGKMHENIMPNPPGSSNGPKNMWKWESDNDYWEASNDINAYPWQNWHPGEPNNWGGGEHYMSMIIDTGKWNDIFSSDMDGKGRYFDIDPYAEKKNPYATGYAVYETNLTNKIIYTIEPDSIHEQIIGIEDDILTLYQTIENDELTNAISDVRNQNIDLRNNLLEHNSDLKKEKESIKKHITRIDNTLHEIDKQIDFIDNLNNNSEGFNNLLDNNMREGMTSQYVSTTSNSISNVVNNLLRELERTDDLELNEHRNFMLELAAQKENILSNVIMDYMINEEGGSTANSVYEKINQENIDKQRKIKINNYYTKTHKEYIHLLKIIILLISLLIPILILNRNDFISKDITLLIVVVVLFLGAIYILYRLYLLYMRDDKDFDKIRIPYDRQASELVKQGKMKNKSSPLKGLGITCIGNECCDASMVYDNLRNKCILQENFGNFFEDKLDKLLNNNLLSNVIEESNIHEDNSQYTYITESFSCKTKNTDTDKQTTSLLIDSLKNSSRNNMYKNSR